MIEMDIRNETPFADGLALGLGPERQPCLSVIVKGTFAIPEKRSGRVEPLDVQREVRTDDEYFQNDVTGSLRLEADNVPFKPRADVVVVGTAYAPNGKPVRELDVSLRVGRAVHEVVRVVGDREWVFPTRMAVVPRTTDPVPFTEMPLRYERAYGGMDHKANKWFSSNPIGRGFIGEKSKQHVDRTPLPNLEDPRDEITSWDDRPQPVGFGFFRKDWQPRAGYAGFTEEEVDVDEEFGLPSDFQFAFYNGAHPRLQVPDYLRGDEQVELRHFTPDAYRQFSLPGVRPRVAVRRRSRPEGGDVDRAPGARSTQSDELDMHLDTLVLLPEDEEFYIVWRGRTPLQDVEHIPEQVREIEIAMSDVAS